jgi:hypothetical protein
MAVGSLAVSVGVLTAAAPAHADTLTDSFLSALNDAGVGYDDPANAVALGQSICPLLAQPGGSFAGAASNIANNGISPDMASLFTSIAISMYCPSMMASVANGDWLDNGGLPALPFDIPGLPSL